MWSALLKYEWMIHFPSFYNSVLVSEITLVGFWNREAESDMLTSSLFSIKPWAHWHVGDCPDYLNSSGCCFLVYSSVPCNCTIFVSCREVVRRKRQQLRRTEKHSWRAWRNFIMLVIHCNNFPLHHCHQNSYERISHLKMLMKQQSFRNLLSLKRIGSKSR